MDMIRKLINDQFPTIFSNECCWWKLLVKGHRRWSRQWRRTGHLSNGASRLGRIWASPDLDELTTRSLQRQISDLRYIPWYSRITSESRYFSSVVSIKQYVDVFLYVLMTKIGIPCKTGFFQHCWYSWRGTNFNIVRNLVFRSLDSKFCFIKYIWLRLFGFVVLVQACCLEIAVQTVLVIGTYYWVHWCEWNPNALALINGSIETDTHGDETTCNDP